VLASFSNSYRRLTALRTVERSATESFERMTRDIRGASSVDLTASTINSHPGILTLVTSNSGVSTTTKFYLDNGTFKVDVNGIYIGPLTTSNVTVTNLTYQVLTSTYTTAVKIDMTLEGTSGGVTVVKSYHTTVILKDS
jgi:hypothetical protein